jgi:hypothetical protein
MRVPSFSAKDRNLPGKVLGSFLLAGCMVTAPLKAATFANSVFENPILQILAEGSSAAIILTWGWRHMNGMIKKIIQDVGKQIHPLYRVDLDGARMASLSAMLGGLCVNSGIYNNMLNLNPDGTSMSKEFLLAAGAVCVYATNERIKTLLEKNHWTPPTTPRQPRRNKRNQDQAPR